MPFHRYIRKWNRCLLAFASALTFAVMAASPAGAEAATSTPASGRAGIGQCPASSFCMWQNSNYNTSVSGGFWAYTYGNYALYTWFYVGDSANDKASSLYNNRAWATGIDKDYNPADTTDLYCLAGHYQNANLSPYAWHDGSNENDSISAFWHATQPSNCGF
jgi:Peptidase inhibitor family I36